MQTEKQFITKKVAVISIMLAVVLIASIIERMIPFDFFVPGVKLGLSNVVILIAIYILDFRSSLTLTVLKCVVLVLLTGNITAFLYSLSGSLSSFFIMWAAAKIFDKKKQISPIGVSVLGAVFHNFGQIIAAAFVMGTINVAAYLPILIISGVITGILVGVMVKLILKHLKTAL